MALKSHEPWHCQKNDNLGILSAHYGGGIHCRMCSRIGTPFAYESGKKEA